MYAPGKVEISCKTVENIIFIMNRCKCLNQPVTTLTKKKIVYNNAYVFKARIVCNVSSSGCF